jgi:hypothetical protein
VLLFTGLFLAAACAKDASVASSGAALPDAGCPPSGSPGDGTDCSEAREPCADHNPLRNAYFGDLHVHTALSFDAYSDDVRTGPADAYAFAKGQPIALPPLDATGNGTQTLQLAKPLDFAAVTDHSEFLGEVATCITPGSASYDSPSCVQYRAGGQGATTAFGLQLAAPNPMRQADICDGTGCPAEALDVWQRIREAAENAYDRTAACSFTSLIAYEWTGTPPFVSFLP